MLRNNSKQFGKSIMVSPEEEKEGYGGEGLQKMKFFKAWNERVTGWWNTNNNNCECKQQNDRIRFYS